MSTSTTSTERKALGLRLAPWLGCLAMIGLLILATTQWNEWSSSRRIQCTQNAYVKSDFAVLSAKVSGYVKALPLGDYEQVKAGDLIAQIDPADYELAVAAAQAAGLEVVTFVPLATADPSFGSATSWLVPVIAAQSAAGQGPNPVIVARTGTL